MMDNAEEENPKTDKTKFEDAEDDNFKFFGAEVKFQEIVLGGQISVKMLHKC